MIEGGTLAEITKRVCSKELDHPKTIYWQISRHILELQDLCFTIRKEGKFRQLVPDKSARQMLEEARSGDRWKSRRKT